MANFLDKTGLSTLWNRIKGALPFKSVYISGEANGWLKLAKITCNDPYMNTPIVLHIICRGFPASTVEMMLQSEDRKTPGMRYFIHRTSLLGGTSGESTNVGYTYEDVDGVRTYTLWKKKNERYGNINVHADCANNWTKFISYETGISYTEPEGIVYANVRYEHVMKQTAYSAKGSATKIPQVTTNAAGQVTLINEVDLGNAPTATNPLATKLTASDDLNDIKGDRRGVWWYYWTATSVPANARSNASSYMEVVRMHDGNYLFQTVYEANVPHLYRRQCRNGTWDAWYRYAKSSTTLSGYGITNAYTKTEVDGLLDGKLDNDGDGSSLTETFTAASSRANIASGESNATIFGKIAKWLSDLKALAFKDKVGTGDVESGTYGISVSGNAATASAAQSGSALETAINGKYTKPSGGIPKTDLASAVQTSLGKADTALQSESDPVFLASPAAEITYNDISNWNGKANKKAVPNLADWDSLTATAIYEITSQASNVQNSPEPGKMTLIVINPSSGFITQLAMGYHTYRRYYHSKSSNPNVYEWTAWEAMVTSPSPLKIVRNTVIGTATDTLYLV